MRFLLAIREGDYLLVSLCPSCVTFCFDTVSITQEWSFSETDKEVRHRISQSMKVLQVIFSKCLCSKKILNFQNPCLPPKQ